jgi:hypothetical protein
MTVRKHQLLDDAVPDHLLNEHHPRHVLQHILIRLPDFTFDVSVRGEPLPYRKLFLVPLTLPPHNRILRALV